MQCKTLIVGGVLLLAMAPAHAGVFADDLTRCLVAAVKPADNVAMVRWMFSALSANPRIKDLAKVTAEQREQSDSEMARLVDRLLTQECRSQVVQVVKAEGQASISGSFSILGEMAGRQLMSSPETAVSVEGFVKKLDLAKLEQVLAEGGVVPAKEGEGAEPE